MKSLWLAWLPLLFLPNFGRGRATSFGTLDLSDFLIGPFVLLVAPAGLRRSNLAIHRLSPTLLGFAAWTFLSTVLIRERYGYADHRAVLIGLLKLGKLSLYAFAAVFVARALVEERRRHLLPWALTAAGVIVAVSLVRIHDQAVAFDPDQAAAGYEADNAVSVMMAILLCYLGGLWASGQGTRRWRSLAPAGMALMVPGFLASHGRGGWFAALCGTAYIFYRRGLGLRILVGLACLVALIAIVYIASPEFATEMDRTIWPDEAYLNRYKMGVGGFDDGARLTTWSHELGALSKSPMLGTGFFHRGGLSGLWDTGSHNFFLQMFLETGIVGGLLILNAFRRMWQLAGSAQAVNDGQDVPMRASLIAAFVGGVTGEYFYGGMALFTLLLVFAPIGGLGIPDEMGRPDGACFEAPDGGDS